MTQSSRTIAECLELHADAMEQSRRIGVPRGGFAAKRKAFLLSQAAVVRRNLANRFAWGYREIEAEAAE